MKSLVSLLKNVLLDIEDACCVSTSRDLKTIMARIEEEGDSFLTISLSNYGSDLQKGLDRGYVAHDLFQGFSRTGALPKLFSGLLELIFDRVTGRLLDVPDVDAILYLRQISLMWAKIARPTTEKRNRAAISKYMECERDVRESDLYVGPGTGSRSDLGRISSLLFREVLSSLDRMVYSGDGIVPRHGPGQTADRLVGNHKYDLSVWTSRLEYVFPSGKFARASFRAYLESPLRIDEPGEEQPVKVVLVPKTMKTPRIIAMEPTCMQYMQQALLQPLVKAIESDKLARHFVGFTDQVPNQELAMKGSLDGSLATLDLSEASDRVSNQHVRILLERYPSLAEGVDATRSRKADVDGHGVIRLAKFASMGSALCFPFEAMVFTTVVFIGIEKVLNRQLTRKDLKSFIGRVRVYGDDIIVPVEYALSVVESLEAFGFRVNSGKSFWTGKFRESCGKDYYAGQDVSLVRLRSDLPTQQQHTSEIVSIADFRNQLYKAGYWKSVRYLDGVLEDLKLPWNAVLDTSPGIGKFSFLGYQTDGWDNDLQRPLVRAMVIRTTPRVSKLDGWGAMLKYFLKDSELPFLDPKHLEYAGRPVAVNIKHRRVVPY
nr:MAG: RNA-dependent RNA polymerase [Leviviridae sp.]